MTDTPTSRSDFLGRSGEPFYPRRPESAGFALLVAADVEEGAERSIGDRDGRNETGAMRRCTRWSSRLPHVAIVLLIIAYPQIALSLQNGMSGA